MNSPASLQALAPGRSSRVRHVLFVTGGAIAGQGIVIASMPILTRLYSPGTFGLYAVFVALVGLFSTIVSLHFELAIPLPRRETHALRVLQLAVLSAAAFSSLLGLLAWVFKARLFALVHARGLEPFVWLMPCVLFLTGLATVLSTWAIRREAFGVSAIAKTCQGVGQCVPQVAGGLLGDGLAALLIGQVVGQLAAAAALVPLVPPPVLRLGRARGFAKLRASAYKYRKFPLLTTWSSLINALSANLPVLMLSLLFGAGVAGFFALSRRVLQVPARFVGQSTSQVFFAMAAQAHRTDSLAPVTQRVFESLLAFALPTFGLAACVLPEVTRMAFGARWMTSGVYAQWLMPWIMFSLISETLSRLVSVLQKQGQELALQIGYLLLIVGALTGGAFWGSRAAIALLGVSCGAFLVIKTLWLLRLAGVSLRRALAIGLLEAAFAAPGILLLRWAEGYLRAGGAVGSAAVLLVLMHGINYGVRGVYGGRRVKAA
ncbi:MAG: oligosaccharide flippase family protein [Betaproteobacteria bacterium]|nr:oligosaccharide flippase family protein [Betaproteobacteria bacterium]